MRKPFSIDLLILLLAMGCASHKAADRLTLGTVQKEIHKGMSQAEVQAAMGAPNIISKNAEGREVWTYDKVSKQSAARSFLFWTSRESTQKTLTVLITFDEGGKVVDYTYHATEF